MFLMLYFRKQPISFFSLLFFFSFSLSTVVFKEVLQLFLVPLGVERLSSLSLSQSSLTLMSSFMLGVEKEEMKCLKY